MAKTNFFPYEKEKQILNELYDITCPSASHQQRVTADESDPASQSGHHARLPTVVTFAIANQPPQILGSLPS